MITKTKMVAGMAIVFMISAGLLYFYVYFTDIDLSAREIMFFGTFLVAVSLLTDIIKNIFTSSQSHQ